MSPTAGDEAEILAGLLSGGRAATTPPTRDIGTESVAAGAVKPSWPRIVIMLVVSLALLLALIFLAPPLLEQVPPFAGTALFAAAIGLIAWGAARVSGGRLLGAGVQALRQASLWTAIGFGAMAWCGFALALGGRLRGDDAPAGIAVLAGVAATLLQAASEEIFFRGWVQPAITRVLRPQIALAIAAALFAAVHLAGDWFAPLSLVNILLGGFWFGLLAQRTKGLAAPIAAHWAWNATETCVFGFYPNPGYGPWGALFGRDIIGAAAWGGSEEGLNASVLVTCTIGAIVLLLAAPRRRQFI